MQSICTEKLSLSKKRHLIYIIAVMGILLIPLIGMPFTSGGESTENRTLASPPSLTTDEGRINTDFLADAGEYFQDHFGFREGLVTANAVIRSAAFSTSASDSVIVGTDGWLYYSDSLDDFQGNNLLSSRGIFNIAHSLAMTQQFAEERGIRFVFAVAPNKNTLYPEHMPYYTRVSVSEDGNYERLREALEAEQVNFVDLEKALGSSSGKADAADGLLYHRTDSHWNNLGAGIATDVIMDALGQPHPIYAAEPYEVRSDFEGDLAKMLYPSAVKGEEELYFSGETSYTYTEPIESTFDPAIEADNPAEGGSLVMYRDSFGNALVPLAAECFGHSYFSRGVPYTLTDLDLYEADALVIERAERFLPDMAENPPVMPAPMLFEFPDVWDEIPEESPEEISGEIPEESADEISGEISEESPDEPRAEAAEVPAGEEGRGRSVTELQIEDRGALMKLSGFVNPDLLTDSSRICLQVDGEVIYEAFPASVGEGADARDNAFIAYLETDYVPETFELDVYLMDEYGMHHISGPMELSTGAAYEE